VTETPILQRIRLAIGAMSGVRIFRCNNGTGWVGEIANHTPDRVIIVNPRPLRTGLCAGSSDLIGWRTVTINGRKIAQFVAIEVKSPTGRATPEQSNFIEQVNLAGGLAGIAHSPEDAVSLFKII